jgi:Dipeptidyl aminopeptidases/acylaminoacyl-peptidases
MTGHPGERIVLVGECGDMIAHFYMPDDDRPGPAIVVNHGSNDHQDSKPGVSRLLSDAGYRVLVPNRRGYSGSAGPSLAAALTAPRCSPQYGEQVCARLLAEASDIVAAVTHVRAMPGVDASRVAVLGSSYGGITSLLAAALDPTLAACVSFAAAAMSWGPVPAVQPLLRQHVETGSCPVLFLQAANDFDLAPSEVLARVCRRIGRDHDRVILPAIGANEMEAHQIWIHAPFLWAPVVLPFLTRVL